MAAYRFEENWSRVRARRIALVAAAREGNSTAMDDLRTLCLHAGIFAILSVHNQVTQQELQYERWMNGEPITGLGMHVRAVESVGGWIAAHMTLDLFDDLTGRTFVEAALDVPGLGPAKATFFGALLGFDDCPCLDTHMCKMLAIKPNWNSTPAGLRRYRKALALSPFHHTLDQWRAFLMVKRFALTQHDCFFQAILPDAVVESVVTNVA